MHALSGNRRDCKPGVGWTGYLSGSWVGGHHSRTGKTSYCINKCTGVCVISPQRTLVNTKLPLKTDSEDNADACRLLSLCHHCWIHRPSTIVALLHLVLAFLVSVKQQRGSKMRLHCVQQSQITTPTRSIPNAYLCIPDPQRWSHIILMILVLLLPSCYWKTHQNEAEYIFIIHLRVIFIFKKFPIGLKENLREEDNLSTRDKWPVPNVSFVRRFCCTSIRDVVICPDFITLCCFFQKKAVAAGGDTDDLQARLDNLRRGDDDWIKCHSSCH